MSVCLSVGPVLAGNWYSGFQCTCLKVFLRVGVTINPNEVRDGEDLD